MEGTDRRQFLKRAGVVAWTIPAMQVVNMTGALAGVETSVTKTDPPSTTRPPPCVEVTYRVKAEWTGDGWSWDTGVGAKDCIQSGFDHAISGADAAIVIDGDDETVTVKHEIPECKITLARFKAGESCSDGEIGEDGAYASFTAGAHGISHIELVFDCCETVG